MPKRILILTIGGSCAPIIKSINSFSPEKVIFLCSDDNDKSKSKGSYISVIGEGKVCGSDWKNPDRPNIITQCELEDNEYTIIKIKNIDDLDECYKIAFDKLVSLRKEYPSAEIIADYTGGTKSMTAGLVMAASDVPDIVVSVVKGSRNNLISTTDGTERVSKNRSNYAHIIKQLTNIHRLIKNYDYAAAKELLDTISSNIFNIPDDLEEEIDWLYSLVKAFDYWDKFQHVEAFKLLKIRKYSKDKTIGNFSRLIQVLLKSKSFLDTEVDLPEEISNTTFKYSNFTIVWDLIFNADRKAHQKRYDDAVARIYRSIELFIQIHLKTSYGQITSDIDLEKLPNEIRIKYTEQYEGQNTISIGLLESYSLLRYYEPEGQVWQNFKEIKNKLLDKVLKTRNYSILAHGFTPITEKKYKEIYKIAITGFLKPLLETYKINTIAQLSQLPTELDQKPKD